MENEGLNKEETDLNKFIDLYRRLFSHKNKLIYENQELSRDLERSVTDNMRLAQRNDKLQKELSALKQKHKNLYYKFINLKGNHKKVIKQLNDSSCDGYKCKKLEEGCERLSKSLESRNELICNLKDQLDDAVKGVEGLNGRKDTDSE